MYNYDKYKLMAMLDRFVVYLNTTSDTTGASKALTEFVTHYGAPLVFTNRLDLNRIMSHFTYSCVSNFIEHFGGKNLWDTISLDPYSVNRSVISDRTGYMIPAIQKSIIHMLQSEMALCEDCRSRELLYSADELSLTNELTGETIVMDGRDIDSALELVSDGWECKASLDEQFIYSTILPNVVVALFNRSENGKLNINNISIAMYGRGLSKSTFTDVMDSIVESVWGEIRMRYILDTTDVDMDDSYMFVDIFRTAVDLVKTQMEVIGYDTANDNDCDW